MGIFDFLKNNRQLRAFLDEYSPQLRKMAVIVLLGLVIFAGSSLVDKGNEPELETARGSSSEVTGASAAEETSEAPAGSREDASPYGTIYVDIGGAVKNPMLAELPDGSRVDDAIKAAGGLKKEADMTTINRAEFLVDGQKIFIPSFALDEDGNIIETPAASAASSGGGTAASTSTADPSGKVNINTADSTQLQTLNGVGPATAQKIIDYREANGRFASVEDIRNVSGIGDKTFEKLKEYITI